MADPGRKSAKEIFPQKDVSCAVLLDMDHYGFLDSLGGYCNKSGSYEVDRKKGDGGDAPKTKSF
uniref:Uncharacterized protein n=1 Tax=Romanomermis culicivorax TaxID=13658 RepID=A0A915ICF5_ROMCU